MMETPSSAEVLDQVRAALNSEPRFKVDVASIAMTHADGILTLDGEAGNVAAKKRALERAAAVPRVTGIVDRLHVTPAQPMGDKEIRDLVRDALLQEPALAECRLREHVKGEDLLVRASPGENRGDILIRVEDGIVTLDGDVTGLGQKRLAGVLAWWVPGSRDVVNGLGVEPDEPDNDDEIRDAVRLVLEKDPFVDASQIRVGCADYAVTLEGIVPTESERDMAEFDAWYVFGVDRVTNRIEVRP
jgi:osmotically-inducible protein OsmY